MKHFMKSKIVDMAINDISVWLLFSVMEDLPFWQALAFSCFILRQGWPYGPL